jgi:hypothetical protein
MRAVYAHGDQWRHDYGPVALPASPDTLFSFNVYHGGALVLYALRQVVGTATSTGSSGRGCSVTATRWRARPTSSRSRPSCPGAI